jgi:hypothetical protein
MTLTEFLLARIAEDAEWAQEAIDLSDGLGVTREWRWVRLYGSANYPKNPSSSSFYSGAPSPARVLADCEAKRGAVTAAWDDLERIEGEWGRCQSREQMDAKDDVPAVVAYLAAVYADHPDYREEWKP